MCDISHKLAGKMNLESLYSIRHQFRLMIPNYINSISNLYVLLFCLSISLLSAQHDGVELVVLGTVQDAGSPHMACKKSCCIDLWTHPDSSRKVVSLGIHDYIDHSHFVIEASPDFPSQMQVFLNESKKVVPDAIFITHGHIGHYTGLMYLGKESMNSKLVPVYTMPRMTEFLSKNGPWDLLVKNENIVLRMLDKNQDVELSDQLTVRPLVVPHRDEYSETVGYIIEGPSKRLLFIPDIDKWTVWEDKAGVKIEDLLKEVDFALLDATFYDEVEINYRDIKQIPHPFVVESMARFSNLEASEKNKIHFIHLNHTNPLLNPQSEAYRTVVENGYKVAHYLQIFRL